MRAALVVAVVLLAAGAAVEDGAENQIHDAVWTDDAVIIEVPAAHPAGEETHSRWRRRRRAVAVLNGTRESRQFLHAGLRQVNSLPDSNTLFSEWTPWRPIQSEGEAFGLECETTLGKRGVCKTFRDCYPYFKVAELTGWDGWVMGHYDTCSFISGDNMEVFGVCCTEPVQTPPQQQPDVQRGGIAAGAALAQLQSPLYAHLGFGPLPLGAGASWPPGAVGAASQRQVPAGWPPAIPPLPTHPPDHTAPTHPPPFGATTSRPTLPTRPPNAVTYPTKGTTRPTYQTTKATTKQSWPPAVPTHPAAVRPPPAAGGGGGAAVGGSCGIKNGYQDQERIVGGKDADLNEWPWIVALFNGGRQFCGGSLIDDQHVLSAAHCVAHMTSWDVARLTARMGDHNIRSNSETQHVERKIKRVVRHRGFDMRTLYNDISLLTIDAPVKFSKTIRPICLPGGARAYSGLVATVIGWGSLRENGHQPSVLQKVSIPIWSNTECRLKYGAAAPGGIVEHMLCAGRAAHDSCSGDSGGPLMVAEGGRWTQVGVVSWGIGCGKGQYPGVYTRLTHFLPWIQKNSK